jgi:hypothetical protein
MEAPPACVCDFCGRNFDEENIKAEQADRAPPGYPIGGIRFNGQNACPTCAPKIERDIRVYQPSLKERITDRAKPLERFCDFIMRMPRKQIVSTGLDDAEMYELGRAALKNGV